MGADRRDEELQRFFDLVSREDAGSLPREIQNEIVRATADYLCGLTPEQQHQLMTEAFLRMLEHDGALDPDDQRLFEALLSSNEDSPIGIEVLTVPDAPPADDDPLLSR